MTISLDKSFLKIFKSMVSEKLNPFFKIIVGITLFQTRCAKTDTLETKEEESCTSQQNKWKQNNY